MSNIIIIGEPLVSNFAIMRSCTFYELDFQEVCELALKSGKNMSLVSTV